MQLPDTFLEEMKSVVKDFDSFLRSYNQPPNRAFRINNIKIDDEKLLAFMGRRDKVPFAEHCYYLGENEKLGSHAIHHAGLIYIQEPSAMAAVNAYEIKSDLALDMCASPGGKTIQLASKTKYLVSNEINPSRAAVLKSNIERMGLKNVAVTNHSPKELEALKETFDLVLVDAPCSGEGMFRKDENAINEWSLAHSAGCAVRQAAIMESADKVLKKGGMLIYSTCTFSTRENEEIVNGFLSKHDYELVDPLPEVCAQTESFSDEKMRRFYPHTGMGEGQFFAAMIKKTGGESRSFKSPVLSRNKIVSEFLIQTIGHEIDFSEHGGIFCAPALPIELPLNKIVSGGVRIGKLEGKIFKPDHYFFSAFGKEMFCYEASAEELIKYLHGEELCGDHRGYGAVTVLGAPLGGFKGSDGRYKNLYPKGLRI